MSDETRARFGAAFAEGGELYERVRPNYPAAAAQWLIPPRARTVLDLGAGTGKFTRHLVTPGRRVLAVDPSDAMLRQLRTRLPAVTTRRGTAESIPLPEASVDAVFAAQCWHWFDADAASSEIARVLVPGGALALVSNQLDVSQPWIHRLSRIIHAGDVHRPRYQPDVGKQFRPLQSWHTMWSQTLDPSELVELAKSRSYYLRAGPEVRERVLAHLHWYLYQNLGHKPGYPLQLPYATTAWKTALREQV